VTSGAINGQTDRRYNALPGQPYSLAEDRAVPQKSMIIGGKLVVHCVYIAVSLLAAWLYGDLTKQGGDKMKTDRFEKAHGQSSLLVVFSGMGAKKEARKRRNKIKKTDAYKHSRHKELQSCQFGLPIRRTQKKAY
jgi:hypothetical protein